MTCEEPSDRAIDRFYEIEDAHPTQCEYGVMLVNHVMYRVAIQSISRSGKTVYYRCDGRLASAKRDSLGEWQSENEPHWPIRFVRRCQTPPISA